MDSDVFLAWPLFCIDTLVDVHHHHHHHCLIILMEMCAIRKTSVTDLARLEFAPGNDASQKYKVLGRSVTTSSIVVFCQLSICLGKTPPTTSKMTSIYINLCTPCISNDI